MKRTLVDLREEQQIVTCMIVNTDYLREIIPVCSLDYFESNQGKRIAQWCFDYYKQYQKAPYEHIEDLFGSWSRNHKDDPEIELIRSYLTKISAQYERMAEVNVPYLLDRAEQYFGMRSVKVLIEDLTSCVTGNELTKAESLIGKYKKPKRIVSGAINPFNCPEAVHEAFEKVNEPLIPFPGPLGDLMNDQFVRDSLVGFLAGEKKGKTFWLIELAVRGFRARNNVLYIAVGDMTRDQMIRRLYVYLAKRHFKMKKDGYIKYPMFDCLKNQYDLCDMRRRTCNFGIYNEDGKRIVDNELIEEGYVPCDACRILEPREYYGAVWNATRKADPALEWFEGVSLANKFMKSLKGKEFKLQTYPNRGITVAGIKDLLDIQEYYEGFVPDIIIIDYADNIAASSRLEFRHQQNEIWQDLRALSQERRCLVITATQADAKSYGKKSLDLSNFSEDKRKYAHVTAMFALNKSDEDKKNQLARFAALVLREVDYNMDDEVYVLQCLDIGRPFLGSFTPRKLKELEKEK